MAASELSRPGQSACACPYQSVAYRSLRAAKHHTQGLVSATCEMAREFLIADRTGPPRGEGLKY